MAEADDSGGDARVKTFVEDVMDALRAGMREATEDMADFVVQVAKGFVPVDTGNLGRNIMAKDPVEERDGVSIYVGAYAEYACMYTCPRDGYDPLVKTDGAKGRKWRHVTDLKPGMMVLTHEGRYRPITAVSTFPAKLKPELVTLRYESYGPNKRGWVETTVTIDHRVLVERNGQNVWVVAGEVTANDFLLRVPKEAPPKAWKKGQKPVNRGASHTEATKAKMRSVWDATHKPSPRKYEERNCTVCGGKFTVRSRERKLTCSEECRDEAVARSHRGRKRPEATRARLRAAWAKKTNTILKVHRDVRRLLARSKTSRSQMAVYNFVKARMYEDAVLNFPIPGTRRFADVGVPSLKLDIEVDGSLHEPDGDRRRDVEVAAVGWRTMRIPVRAIKRRAYTWL